MFHFETFNGNKMRGNSKVWMQCLEEWQLLLPPHFYSNALKPPEHSLKTLALNMDAHRNIWGALKKL